VIGKINTPGWGNQQGNILLKQDFLTTLPHSSTAMTNFGIKYYTTNNKSVALNPLSRMQYVQFTITPSTV